MTKFVRRIAVIVGATAVSAGLMTVAAPVANADSSWGWITDGGQQGRDSSWGW